MSEEEWPPKRLPVRYLEGQGWQVLLPQANGNNDEWLEVDGEDDARLIARAPVLRYEYHEHPGSVSADELDRAARALRRYWPCLMARMLARFAADMRTACD